MIKILSLLVFVLSCTSLPFPKSNLSNDQILSLRQGQTSQEVASEFGNPLSWQNFDDGSYVHLYTNDWQDGAQVFCRNVAIAYGADDKLIKNWFTKDGNDPQERCNRYSQYSAQQAASWSSFASSISESIDQMNRTDNGGDSCYSDSGCSASQVCAKKKTAYGTLEMQGVCVNVRYYEDN